MFAREKKEEKPEVGKHLRIKVERYSIERRGRKRERERRGTTNETMRRLRFRGRNGTFSERGRSLKENVPRTVTINHDSLSLFLYMCIYICVCVRSLRSLVGRDRSFINLHADMAGEGASRMENQEEDDDDASPLVATVLSALPTRCSSPLLV